MQYLGIPLGSDRGGLTPLPAELNVREKAIRLWIDTLQEVKETRHVFWVVGKILKNVKLLQVASCYNKSDQEDFQVKKNGF